jgi:CheY-like chemotaxis protein
MNKDGPIVILDDDDDDIELYKAVLTELGIRNNIMLFTNSEDMLEYVHEIEVKPFLIISDINMPRSDGFQIRSIISSDKELKKKCIPYIFITTDASPRAVEESYNLSVQGIFQKPSNYDEWKRMLTNIINYWTDCMAPR